MSENTLSFDQISLYRDDEQHVGDIIAIAVYLFLPGKCDDLKEFFYGVDIVALLMKFIGTAAINGKLLLEWEA